MAGRLLLMPVRHLMETNSALLIHVKVVRLVSAIETLVIVPVKQGLTQNNSQLALKCLPLTVSVNGRTGVIVHLLVNENDISIS